MDIAIIGGGMAGLSAGLYAARGGADCTVFEQFLPGGQSATILRLENYPGFADGVEGAALMQAAAEQAERAGCQFRYENVVSINPGGDGQPHTLVTDQGQYQPRAVILASGAIPRRLGVAREAELTGRGVSYCASCDGALFRGKRVAVVGGGDTALTDALVLARYAEKVLLIHRRREFRGSAILQQQVRHNDKIELLLDKRVDALLGGSVLSGLELYDLVSGLHSQVEAAGLFVAVGVSPVSEFVSQTLELDASGRIVTDRRLRTSQPGIFAAGDCRDTPLRQVITAAADGAVAATAALEYLVRS